MLESKLFLEVGVNHIGNINLADDYLNFFLRSDYQNLTFMIHNQNFYDLMNKKKKNYLLPKKFYQKAITLAHKNKKKIGLSVCDIKSYNYIKDLNFDFYKLLGIAINNKEVIKVLRLKKKQIYISLSQGDNIKINTCLKYFKSKKNLNLIYTYMSYNPEDLDLNRIGYIKSKFKLPVGYGNHYQGALPIYLSSFFNPSFYFIYIKHPKNKKILFPDNKHAFFTTELKKICKNIKESIIMFQKKKFNNKIKIKSVINEKKI
jgi:sialic acid synthase SpsE